MVEFLSVSWHGRRKKGSSSSHGTGGGGTAESSSSGASTQSPSRARSPRISSSTAAQWHDDLKAIEAGRRAKSSTLIDSIRLNIQSHKDLLDDSILETNQAHRLVLGLSQVHELMANSGVEEPHYPSKVLYSLKQCEEVVQEGFKESSEQLSAVDGKLLKAIAELHDFKAQLDSEGSAVLGTMAQLEEQVVQAWEVYLDAVTASGRNRSSTSGRFTDLFQSGSFHGPTDASTAAGKDETVPTAAPSSKKDPWLSELQYRQALRHQKACLDAGLKVLEELLAQVSGYECRRRINLREYMILVSQSHKLVFQTAEAAQTVAVRDWIEKEVTAQDIQEQVAKVVQEKLERLMQESDGDDEEEDAGEGDNADDPNGVGQDSPDGLSSDPLSVALFYANLFPTASPLQSEFLASACVVERISRGNLGGTSSTLALAVVTTDQMLHLFEPRPDSGLALDDPPERALDLLLNGAAKSDSRVALSGRDFTLDPTRTVDLTQVQVSLGISVEHAVELSPLPEATQSYAPLCLRTLAAREQAELINAIHGANIPAIF